MRNQILLTAALLFAGMAASAQNLNPVVEVTNNYEQSAAGIEKPDQVIAVPDSLLRFNLDVDYEMRTTPYKGAYEFSPYLVELQPAPRASEEGTLLVRLGAGYGFHPELDAVWSPFKLDNFRMNVYAKHQGYFGLYRDMEFQEVVEKKDFDTSGNEFAYVGSKENQHKGADSFSAVGANALYAWKTGSVTADLSYRNIYALDQRASASHNLFTLDSRVKSGPNSDLYYNLGFRGNYMLLEGKTFLTEIEMMTNDAVMKVPINKKGGIIKVDGGLGANFTRSQARMDFFVESVFPGEGSAGQFGFIPRYVFRLGGLRLNLGLKLAFTFRSDENLYPNKGGYVFPDVHLDYQIVPEDMVLYASATGGNIVQGYVPLLAQNHFLASFLEGGLDNEVEHVNLSAGIRGNIARHFHYDAKLGYAYHTNALMYGLEDYTYPTLNWASAFGLFYMDFEGGWKSESFDADVHLRYQSAKIQKEYSFLPVFAPAAFVAQAKFVYNWGGRIKAGINLDASTARLTHPEEASETVYKIPGYADLGLYGEYGFTRRIAAWLKVGNLLNQDVQRIPFHAEQGIYFTIGGQYRF